MQSTPTPLDQYSRVMVESFDERTVIGVSTGFQAFFGNPLNSGRTVFSDNSTVVDIDIIRGNEKIAALIQRGTNISRPLEVKDASGQKFSSISRKYPLGEEESLVTAEQINSRIAGETPSQAMDRKDRLKVISSQNHDEHAKRFTRMFEVLAAQSILTGKMDSIIGTANAGLQYDFHRSAGNTFSPAIAWDQAGGLPMTDIDAGCRVLRIKGKVKPDMLILGGGSINAMLTNDSFQAQADNRRFELIEVSTNNPVPPKYKRFTDAGFIARGRLRTAAGFELWMFTYIDGYTNSADAYVDYMPLDKALIASSDARCDRYFGPGENMPNASQRLDMMANVFGLDNPESMSLPDIKGSGIVMPNMFHFDAYATHNNKGVVSRTQTAPIFATTMTDAFVVLEELTTP